MLTPFQEACLAATKALADDLRLEMRFSVKKGVREQYLQGSLAGKLMAIEFYIYEDEVGFFSGKKWHAYESQDYSTADGLILRFVEDARLAVG